MKVPDHIQIEIHRLLTSTATPAWQKQRISLTIVLARLATVLARPTWTLAVLTLAASISTTLLISLSIYIPTPSTLQNISTASLLILLFSYACAWWLDRARTASPNHLSGLLIIVSVNIFSAILVKPSASPLAVFIATSAVSYLLLALNLIVAYLLIRLFPIPLGRGPGGRSYSF